MKSLRTSSFRMLCRLDYAGPEILRGESYKGPPQDVWAFGIVSYVLVVGECPFSSAAEAAIGLAPGSKALTALEERCGRSPPSSDSSSQMSIEPPVLFPPASPSPSPVPPFSPAPTADITQLDFSDLFGSNSFHGYDPEREQAKREEGREFDGGGKLGDAMALIKACLQLDIAKRPSFDDLLKSRYLSGRDGWVELDDVYRNALPKA